MSEEDPNLIEKSNETANDAQGAWGDRRTWIIIAILFATSIIIATLAYVMPKGRVSEQPNIDTF